MLAIVLLLCGFIATVLISARANEAGDPVQAD